MGAIESAKTELKQTLETDKRVISESLDSQLATMQQNFTDNKKEILELVGDNVTPNITFRANGISSLGDPGKLTITYNIIILKAIMSCSAKKLK